MGRWDAGRGDVRVAQVLHIVKHFRNVYIARKTGVFAAINTSNCYY